MENKETDEYDVLPFQENIENASKSSPIYGMHMYWTKQDPFVVKKYIEHYTKPGDMVLDAFAGSGMTGVAALLSKRNAILGDISPVCIHIAKNYTTPINPFELEKGFSNLYKKLSDEIEDLYLTKCHNCGSIAKIVSFIFSDVFLCPKCGDEVLYASETRWERMKRGEKFSKIECDNCKYIFSKANSNYIRYEPIEIKIKCDNCRVKGNSKTRYLTMEDWEEYIKIEGGPTKVVKINGNYQILPSDQFSNKLGTSVYKNLLKTHKNIKPKEIPYWFPKDIKFFGNEPVRNFKRGITHPYQMFSQKNLISLSCLWQFINNFEVKIIRDKLIFIFTALLFHVSLMTIYKISGGGFRAGTLYIPSLIIQRNFLNVLKNIYKQIVLGNRELYLKNINNKIKIDISISSATELGLINESIDYAYYDPPYGSNINYSELNIMWEAWLNSITDNKYEIIENKFQGKGRLEYEKMMLKSLQEAYRVLKPDRWLTMIYSYSDPSMYRTIQNIARKAGFIDYGDITHINSISKTKAQLDSDRTQQRYLVINFKKPKNEEEFKKLLKSDNLEFEVIKIVREFLKKYPGMTRDYIYDQVIKKLFPNIKIQKFNLDHVLSNFFRKVGDEWYSPGTLIGRNEKAGEQTSLFTDYKQVKNPEKEIIIKLQEFLKKYGKVYFSELREYYLRKIDIFIEKDFNSIISENFIMEKGFVRLPTKEELEKANNENAIFLKGQIKRVLSGDSIFVSSQIEIFDWIIFCYENKFFIEAWKLFTLIEEEKILEEDYKKIRKIAELCRIEADL